MHNHSLEGSATPEDMHYIVSDSTSECFDTRDIADLDTWECVSDGAWFGQVEYSLDLKYTLIGHNELFNYSYETGLIVAG